MKNFDFFAFRFNFHIILIILKCSNGFESNDCASTTTENRTMLHCDLGISSHFDSDYFGNYFSNKNQFEIIKLERYYQSIFEINTALINGNISFIDLDYSWNELNVIPEIHLFSRIIRFTMNYN